MPVERLADLRRTCRQYRQQRVAEAVGGFAEPLQVDVGAELGVGQRAVVAVYLEVLQVLLQGASNSRCERRS